MFETPKQAVFGTIAWSWNEKREQYYLHQFDVKQPDLNFRNPDVVQEMKDVLTFWMDKGADGFRIDAVSLKSFISFYHFKLLVTDKFFFIEPLKFHNP